MQVKNKGMYRKSHLLVILFLVIFHMSLLLFTDIKFFEDDEVTFYFAAENYAKQRWSISEEEYEAQRVVARTLKDRFNRDNFTQYRKREDGFWVSEKPAGYPLVLSFFHYYGMPRVPNMVLFIILAFAVYLVPNDFFTVKERFYTALLILSCPLVLISSSRFYMVDFFSFATSAIGFVCFFRAVSYSRGLKPGMLYAFLSGVFISLSSFSRITGYANAILIVFFFCLVIFTKSARIKLPVLGLSLLSFIAGILVFLIPNAIYNHKVLGSVFQNPYHIGDMALKIPKHCFSFQYFTSGEPPHPFFYIFRNIITSPQIIILSMPAIIFIFAGIYDFYRNKDKKVLLLLFLVFLSVFGLFLQFYRVSTVNYLWNARPYMQGYFPVAVFSALFISRLRARYRIILTITLIAIGYCMCLDFLYSNHQDPYRLGIAELWHMDQRTGR